MGVDIAITNGILVDSQNIYQGVLYIDQGKIVGISQSLNEQPRKIIDAKGMYVLPGAIDGHVHMMDPGYTDREDFTTGTMAAARGGVTMVIDHHRTIPEVFDSKGLLDKKNYLEKRAIVDFGLLGGLNYKNLKDLKGMWESGAIGFKGYTCAVHEADAILPGNLMEILTEIKRFNGIALFHCEEDSLLKKNEELLRREGRKDPQLIPQWRSPEAEEIAVKTLIYFAKKTGARVAVAHTSLPSLVLQMAQARLEGVSIYTETCPQYLTLTEEEFKTKGPYIKFTPPPRRREDVEGLWLCLSKGLIDMINSDHCPYPSSEKEAGWKDIWIAPFGIPGVETTTPLLLNGVSQGRITISQLVYVRSERPAMIYGLTSQKGYLRVGCDADIAIVDMKRERLLNNSDVFSKCGWTPYNGMKIKGDVVMTMVRGRIVMEEGKVIAEPGWGRFVTKGDIK